MEALQDISHTELLDKFSFKIGSNADYIESKTNASFYPQGSNIYTSKSGVKQLKFTLADVGWLDPDSVRLCFTLKNTSSNATDYLRPIGNPSAFFERFRLTVGGAVVEDIGNFNRVSELFENVLCNEQVKQNDAIEGWGYRHDDEDNYKYRSAYDTNNFPGIKAGESKTVCFKPFSGFLSQKNYIPLRYCPCTFEFTLAGETDAIITPGVNAVFFETSGSTAGNTSKDWEIYDCRILCDVIHLTTGMQNQFDKHLVSDGGSLPIIYDTIVSQEQNVSAMTNNINVNVTRAFTYLKSVWVSFFTDEKSTTTNTKITHKVPLNKSAIEFSHPMQYASENYNPNYEISYQIGCGKDLYPIMPCSSSAESFYRLRDAIALPLLNQHSISIRGLKDYTLNKFIIAQSLVKTSEMGFINTGINSKSGQQLYIRIKPANDPSLVLNLDTMYIFLHAQMALEIRASGVTPSD